MDVQSSGVKDFSEFNIPIKKSFEGPKIFSEDILEQPITVHFYEIRPSTKKGKEDTDWLYVQITLNNQKHLLWGASTFLMDALRKIPESGFPFNAKIIKINRHFEFRGLK